MKLSKYEVKDIMQRLQNGDAIPEDYKYKLFPTKQKEYELVYGGKMRKEDILANEDGVFPVPLQVEKVFNGDRESWDDDWKNIIAFGDNLQFLKTIYENKDPLIKNKVKGKVKLIYIDPPFATESSFKGGEGQRAYSDKTKGADFVEFIRRRLVVAREILAENGSIFIHLDQKMCHQIRLVLDEIFGVNRFQNQIIWQGTSSHNDAKKKYGNIHQVIFWYYKANLPTYNFDLVRDEISKSNLKEYSKIELSDGSVIPLKGNEHRVGNGNRIFRTVDATWKGTSKEKQFTWRGARPNSKREWRYDYDGMEAALRKGELYLTDSNVGAIRCLKRYLDENEGQILQDIWTNVGRMSGGKGTYPTEKPEPLLHRIIQSVTNENEIIIDFFGGSGTTAAVAEKINRKWITCDIGKLSFYTVQKRILNIEKSKSLDNPKKEYGKPAKSFVTVNTGAYDLEKVFKLQQEEYTHFVLNLFEVEVINKTIGGIKITGERKDGYYAFVWPYWDFKDAAVDVDYLENLHTHIGKKAGDRLYIIAPASYVDFISDYYEIGKVRYYFLKVPYHIVKELHKVQFKKFRQPQSKNNVNDLDDAVGFHFMKQPDVLTKVKMTKKTVSITIEKFLSDFSEDEKGEDLENFESLAMVLLDKDFDGQAFDMDEYYFAEDLLPKDEATEEISLPAISKDECGTKLMVIYVDIFGNEFKEVFEIK